MNVGMQQEDQGKERVEETIYLNTDTMVNTSMDDLSKDAKTVLRRFQRKAYWKS